MSAPVTPSPKSRRRRVLVGILLLLAAVAVVRAVTVQPRPPKPYLQGKLPVVLAHQGASGYAPSNTMEAFKLGMAQGADIIETDVHLTKDGVVVTSHDATVDRMTNGQGYIKSMTLAELRTYDFGYRFTPDGGATYPYRGKGVTIPTLEEVFSQFPGVRVNIEIKQSDPPMEQAVWDVIRKAGAEDLVLINSTSGDVMKAWNSLTRGRTAVGASYGDVIKFLVYYLPHVDWLYNPTVDAFQVPDAGRLGPVNLRLDEKRFVERAHKVGMAVHYWTINDEPTMRHLFSIGADGIITDYPDRAVKVLKEMGLR